jgi:SAM-dependent methyltransferase
VTGVDVSTSAIALARTHFALRGLSGAFAVADGSRLPFPDGSFDLLYCHGVLPYAADPAGIVREARRVLGPGGKAVFMAYNRNSWLAWLARGTGVALEHSDAPVFRMFARDELDRLLVPFERREIVPERFPVPSRLHGGVKGVAFNHVLVPAMRAVPRRWIRPIGWHLMAFCETR